MGSFSGSGERAAMMGATELGLGDYLIASIQAIRGYGDAATKVKGAYEIETPQETFKALRQGLPWQKLGMGFSGLFDVKSLRDTLDASEGEVDHPDIFKASNGLEINLQKLRDLNLDRINLPSRYQDAVVMGQNAIEEIAAAFGVNTSQVDALNEALEHIGFDKVNGEGTTLHAGEATQKALRVARHLKLDVNRGIHSTVTSLEESQALSSLLADAETEIRKQVGQDFADSGKQADTRAIEREVVNRMEQFGLNTISNHLNKIGFTEGAIIANKTSNPRWMQQGSDIIRRFEEQDKGFGLYGGKPSTPILQREQEKLAAIENIQKLETEQREVGEKIVDHIFNPESTVTDDEVSALKEREAQIQKQINQENQIVNKFDQNQSVQ